MERTGAQIIWEVLTREGTDLVFGYPGGATLPMYDAMLDYPVHHVLVRHEQGAAHMADGFARASGKVGVAIATSGPGATNLVTGIATAMMDSSPIVCITGQVNTNAIGSDAFQETDVTGVTLPITKHNYLVTHTDEIAPVLREAFYIARTGRPGPVLVDITKDAQTGTTEFVWDEDAQLLPGYQPSQPVSPDKFMEAVTLIRAAQRPIILAGHGVLMSGAMQALLDFVDKTGIPVAPTLLGLGGFPASHPLNLGMMGMHGEAWVNQAIQNSDLLLAFGMRFDDRVTGNLDTYAPGAKKIHIDIDPSEINKVVSVDMGIVGDLREVLSALNEQVPERNCSDWVATINERRGDSAVRDIQHHPDNGRLYTAHVINDLWHLSKGRATIVTDVGQHQMWQAQYYKHDYPHKLITSGGLGTMGFGLPAAIGAWFSDPEAEVWAIVGDGGFQMTAAELSTCAQEGVKVNVAVMNNGYLGMVRQWQEFFYERRYAATPLSNPDFVKLADAHGLEGRKVTERSHIAEAYHWAQDQPGTVVLDFRVEKEDNVFPMVSAGADLDNMIRRPETTTKSR
ncbi:MAG: biosynthetic-type acetolactate synthase large subunit [Anaerolineales bacterium]|nr:biosynthetic-type acetolactate synthase large subunit [Anaerolineales bacterium]